MNENQQKVKERPILFSTNMVRAILNGNKTVSRRPVVGGFNCHAHRFHHLEYYPDPRIGLQAYFQIEKEEMLGGIRCPFGAPGDRLWVRETFYPIWRKDHTLTALYRADGITLGTDDTGAQLHWSPAIHMPREVSRLTLEITGISVERVQDITDGDVREEGMGEIAARQTWIGRTSFAKLWDQIYAARGLGWADNPYVWVVRFRPLEA